MSYCINGDGRPVENKDLGLCASCNKDRRKIDNIKLPADPKPIAKATKVKQKELQMYAQLKKRFMLGRWCAYHGRPCIPTDVHHSMGRDGFADDKEIPLLLDVRYFVAVCRDAHNWIEKNPNEAKNQGYSYDRLTKVKD